MKKEPIKNRFGLTKEKETKLIAEIKGYFREERDQEIGDLAASLLIDFFLEKAGNDIYNQGVLDAHRFMGEKLEDLLGIQR